MIEKSNAYWNCIKISFLFFWLGKMLVILLNHHIVIAPIGVYQYIQYDYLFSNPTKYVILILLIGLSVLYLVEKWMAITLFFMLLISILFITYRESSGVFDRDTIFSAVLLAQFIAYFLSKFFPTIDYKKHRVDFSVQIVAANYFLAAISKLVTSGIFWFTEGKYFTLQVLKGFYYQYYNTGNAIFESLAWKRVDWFLNHLPLITILLAISLFFELFSWVALLGKKYRVIMGFLLIGMHIGIYWSMDIIITAVVACMVILYLNPLYYVYKTGIWAKRKESISVKPCT